MVVVCQAGTSVEEAEHMTPLLPRFHRRQLEVEDRAAVERIVREAVPETSTVARATLPGDTRRLRGIPVCAFGVAGVSPGTDPQAALLRSVHPYRYPSD